MGNTPAHLDLNQEVASIEVYQRQPVEDELLIPLRCLCGFNYVAVVAETRNGLYRLETEGSNYWNYRNYCERVKKDHCTLVKMPPMEYIELQRIPWVRIKSWRGDTTEIKLKTVLDVAAADYSELPLNANTETVKRLLVVQPSGWENIIRFPKVLKFLSLVALLLSIVAYLAPVSSLYIAFSMQLILCVLIAAGKPQSMPIQLILGVTVLGLLFIAFTSLQKH